MKCGRSVKTLLISTKNSLVLGMGFPEHEDPKKNSNIKNRSGGVPSLSHAEPDCANAHIYRTSSHRIAALSSKVAVFVAPALVKLRLPVHANWSSKGLTQDL